MTAPIRHPVILTDAQFVDMTRKGAFVRVGRVELRGGVVVAMSPVHINQAMVLAAFFRAFDRALAADCSPFSILSQISIRFGGGSQPTADLVVFDPCVIPANYDDPLPAGAVKLVLEVADTSLADDLGQKQIDYAVAGLSE
jgi:Uma2 family endonuclease